IRPRDGSNPATHDALMARLRSGTDLRALAYVETDDPEELATYLPRIPPDPAESVRVREDGPTRVVLEAQLKRPGLIVLAETFSAGWRLSIDGRPAPVWRANLLMRAAAVTAGSHTLV